MTILLSLSERCFGVISLILTEDQALRLIYFLIFIFFSATMKKRMSLDSDVIYIFLLLPLHLDFAYSL